MLSCKLNLRTDKILCKKPILKTARILPTLPTSMITQLFQWAEMSTCITTSVTNYFYFNCRGIPQHNYSTWEVLNIQRKEEKFRSVIKTNRRTWLCAIAIATLSKARNYHSALISWNCLKLTIYEAELYIHYQQNFTANSYLLFFWETSQILFLKFDLQFQPFHKLTCYSILGYGRRILKINTYRISHIHRNYSAIRQSSYMLFI